MVEATKGKEGEERDVELVLLTPMDAAAFVSDTKNSKGVWCRDLGHGSDGTTLSVSKTSCHDAQVVGMSFVGDMSEVYINVGKISAAAPSFVVDAMRLCAERMMESLLLPSTGSEEEEFG